MALTTFIVVISIENIYNIVVFFLKSTFVNCNNVTNNFWLNQAIWFVSRGSNTVLWVYPFMIMWIIKIKKDQNKVERKKNESKANITTHTSLTDFDNDSESEGGVPEQDEGYKQEEGVYNSKGSTLFI